MGRHDLSYRLFFSHRRMIQDLLRKIIAGPWAELILLAGLPSSAWRELPLIIAILIYNGEEAWNVATDLGSLIAVPHPSAEAFRPWWPYLLVSLAAYERDALTVMNSPLADLFFIETSRDWSDVLIGIRRLRKNTSPEEGALRRACATWLRRVILPRFGLSPEEADLSLEEVETMLAERIDRWNSQIREEGRQEGRQEGRLEGEALVVLRQLRLKFGPLSLEVEEKVRSADADRLLNWSERILTAERLHDVFEG